MSAPRSLGGFDALSAYRAERAAGRLRLRESLRAGRVALRASRAHPEAAEGVLIGAPEGLEEASVFADLLGRAAAELPAPDVTSNPIVADLPCVETFEADALPEDPAVDSPLEPSSKVVPPVAHSDGDEVSLAVVQPDNDEDSPPVATLDDDEVSSRIAQLDGEEVLPPVAPPGDEEVLSLSPHRSDDHISMACRPGEVKESQGDLSAIPELGLGMRLRLAQLGIHTLDDLAASEPGTLRDGLGSISRVLRVEWWIESAREVTGRRADRH